ncbi:MAG: P1 family peptidase [Bacteroidota bacterium]
MFRFLFLLVLIATVIPVSAQRVRELGIEPGVMNTGRYNTITDVEGVTVGHTTLIKGDSIRTGVTAILPHPGNVFQEKVPAAIYIGNGFGKLAGYSQVEELGNIETPIVLTNTLSVPVAANALISYTLGNAENKDVRSANPVVGETNDGWLNDIRGRHVTEKDVLNAIASAKNGPVEEGNVGAGTGTICFGFKGGIGTSSRKLPKKLGGFTVGVLVQTNFGGVLKIDDFNAGEALGKYPFSNTLHNQEDGSCMIVVATDAPLGPRNLKRLAKRAMLGLAKTGGIASNESGDYVIAFSTAEENRIPYNPQKPVLTINELHNDKTSPLFLAVIEATEEAILNSLFTAETMTGYNGHTIHALPKNDILKMMKK